MNPFAIPNDPKAQLVNAAIQKLVEIRGKLERNLDVQAIKSTFLESDPEYIEALRKEAFAKKYHRYLSDKILDLELTT